MKYTFFIRMSDLQAMPITNITTVLQCYTVEMGVSAGDLTRITLDNNHTAYKQEYLSAGGCVCVKIYPPEIMQPSSSTRATIVSAENQNGATIVKATFLFCHYHIVWESNNAGEARGQSWSESLKSRWIPGGSCGYTSGTKRKHFAALSSPRSCWRWLQLQPSCGSPQCVGMNGRRHTGRRLSTGRHNQEARDKFWRTLIWFYTCHQVTLCSNFICNQVFQQSCEWWEICDTTAHIWRPHKRCSMISWPVI